MALVKICICPSRTEAEASDFSGNTDAPIRIVIGAEGRVVINGLISDISADGEVFPDRNVNVGMGIGGIPAVTEIFG